MILHGYLYVDHSTQQRPVHRQEFAELEIGETVTELSIDGGKARLRTEKGQVNGGTTRQ